MQQSSTTAKKRCGGTWTSAFRTACSLYVPSSKASSSEGTKKVLVARCTIARVSSPEGLYRNWRGRCHGTAGVQDCAIISWMIVEKDEKEV